MTLPTKEQALEQIRKELPVDEELNTDKNSEEVKQKHGSTN